VGVSTKGAILSDATLYNGNKGGQGVQQVNSVQSAGGGGAFPVGGNGSSDGTRVGDGGSGVVISILDTSYYWGGGGGGGSYQSTPAYGGRGGGGAGTNNNGSIPTGSGLNGGYSYEITTLYGVDGNPSSGGGGGGSGYTTATAGNGGSGVIILKYRRPLNATAVVDYLKSSTPATNDYKAGISGGDYKIQSIQSATTRDRFVVEASSGSVRMGENAVVVKSSGDVLMNNNVGIGIDPSSSYKLNIKGDINIIGNIYQGGFLTTTGGFQATIAYNIKYSGSSNFLITTRAKYCNLQIYIGGTYGHYIFRDNAVNEFRGNVGGGMSGGNWSYYVPYITKEGDGPRPFVVWVFNGSDTNVLVVENWYN
jgi:hypothetical protein